MGIELDLGDGCATVGRRILRYDDATQAIQTPNNWIILGDTQQYTRDKDEGDAIQTKTIIICRDWAASKLPPRNHNTGAIIWEEQDIDTNTKVPRRLMLVSNRCAHSCDRNWLHKIKAKRKANTLVIILSTNESPHLVCRHSLPISFNRKLENIFGLIVAYCCIPLSPVIGVLSSRVVFCCLQSCNDWFELFHRQYQPQRRSLVLAVSAFCSRSWCGGSLRSLAVEKARERKAETTGVWWKNG